MKKEEPKRKNKKIFAYLFKGIVFSIILAPIAYLFTKNIKYSGIAFLAFFILIEMYFLIKELLKKSAKIKKMEDVFPDFIELMASNLRAGMTIDKALLLSSRKEFSPLDEEILNLGKDIITGKETTRALSSMANRIKSDKIRKTIDLINSGMRSGGNLSILLEDTAVSMRERLFIEKKAASNVLMYVIFIFFATAVGASILFGLSSVLVEVMTRILANSGIDTQFSTKLPFSISQVTVSKE